MQIAELASESSSQRPLLTARMALWKGLRRCHAKHCGV